MAKEIVQTISEYFINDGLEGTKLVKDILFYLYRVTNDNKLQKEIIEWYNKEEYCIQCGGKMNKIYKCDNCDFEEMD